MREKKSGEMVHCVVCDDYVYVWKNKRLKLELVIANDYMGHNSNKPHKIYLIYIL